MVKKRWNWQQTDWGNFSYSSEVLSALEEKFSISFAYSLGVRRHLSSEDHGELVVELVSNEALQTSAIEGEYLDRASLQSSIRREFGLGGGQYRNAKPAEAGVALMMKDVYSTFAEPLSHDRLGRWHEMLMSGRRNIEIGDYRKHLDPMQVVSGRYDKPQVHFEAPPSAVVSTEMEKFIHWFNRTAPGSAESLSPLVRAGISHLYFVSIHPFEDGNGRIARAIVDKSLSQSLGQPSLIALAATIQEKKKDYYDALERNTTGNEITPWLLYFAHVILDAQEKTLEHIDFIIGKAKFFQAHNDDLNPRQKKVVLRIFEEGPNGFAGGLSAKNYQTITRTSAATATRDLQDLVRKGIFLRTGQLKGTRYALKTGLTHRRTEDLNGRT